MKVPYLAPGCFGSALFFQSGNMVCAACPFHTECEPAHEMALAALREKLGVKATAPIRKSKPKAPIPDAPHDPGRLSLPKKVRELLARLDRENLDIAGNMGRGINPFTNMPTYRYLFVACHLILNMETPVTRKVVSAGLQRAMKWAPGTADAHSRMAIQALIHVGALTDTDGIVTVRNKETTCA